MKIIRIVTAPTGSDRALDIQGRHWGVFVNLNQEYVELQNTKAEAQNISNWALCDRGNQNCFKFPEKTVVFPSAKLRVRTGEGQNTASDLFWGQKTPIWDDKGDEAFLYDERAVLIDQRVSAQPPELHLPQLRAEPYPGEVAIALSWDLPIAENSTEFSNPDDLKIFILRRERRFPGTNRQGTVPVRKQRVELPSVVNPDDRSNLKGAYLTRDEDGFLIYDTVANDFQFDFEELWEDQVGDCHILTQYQYRYLGNSRDRGDRLLVRSIQQESVLLPGNSSPIPKRLTVRVIDRTGLNPGTIYYYTAFVGSNYIFSSKTQASALATGCLGSPPIFKALPQIHQQLDREQPDPNTVDKSDRHKGQLQRLLEVFESHADMLHGRVGGLRDIHNIRRMDSHLLPPLAQLMDWHFLDLENEEHQRRELAFAPEFYQTTGTFRLIEAIVHLLTGWQVEMREMATNILMSFDPNRLERIGNRLVYLDGTLKPSPVYLEYLDYIQDPEAYHLHRQQQGLPEQTPSPPPLAECWQGRQWESDRPWVPAGSMNLDPTDPTTTDRVAKLHTHGPDDPNVYSFQAPPLNEDRRNLPDDDHLDLYNQQTIALYLYPQERRQGFSPDELIADRRRLYQILKAFLPINVRVIVFIRPLDIEELFDPATEVTDSFGDMKIRWVVLTSNEPKHRSVSINNFPIDTRYRSWFNGATWPNPDDPTEEDSDA